MTTNIAAGEKIIARCRELARYTEVSGKTTRLHLCPPMREVHSRLRSWMTEAGLTVRLDGAGNLRGLRPASAATQRTLLLGSHLDTVPDAGAFDGILGVLLGLAALEQLRDEPLPYAVELIGFAEEEGVRFGRPFLGSLALTGELSEECLLLQDAQGMTLRESLVHFGAPIDLLPAAQLPADNSTIGFVEIHIEQGPVLETAGQALGVVDAIAGQTRASLTFSGRANHAGTTPMGQRQDALAAAAEWIVAVEQHGHNTEGLVATVGRLEVEPGAPNVIPARATLTLDVRHAIDAVRMHAVKLLLEAASQSARTRAVQLESTIAFEQPAVAMDSSLTDLLAQAAQLAGEGALHMVSGAGHDAMVLARRVPAAMLFLRSPNGISHHPDETVLPSDVAVALDTTLHFLHLLRDHQNGTLRNGG